MREEIRDYNAEKMPEDKRAMALINIATDGIEEAAYKVRIPYEDMDYLKCKTVDALLLLASGMKSKDAAEILSKRYGESVGADSVRQAKRRNPGEFCRMQTFYREIFLNQQLQSMEQKCAQILDIGLSKLVKNGVETASDVVKVTQMMKFLAEARKQKEDAGDNRGISGDQMRALESKMKALVGG